MPELEIRCLLIHGVPFLLDQALDVLTELLMLHLVVYMTLEPCCPNSSVLGIGRQIHHRR